MTSDLPASARSDVLLHFQIIFDSELGDRLHEAKVLSSGPSAGLLAFLPCFGFSTVTFTDSFLGETHSHAVRLLRLLVISFSRVLLEINFF